MADEPKTPETNEDELLLTEVHEPGSEPQPEAGGAEFEIPSFGDEATPQEGDTHLVKHLRKTLAETQRELAEARKSPTSTTVDPGPEPTLESCDYDEERLKVELREWDKKVAEAKKPEVEQQAQVQRQYETERARYTAGKEALTAAGVPNVEDAEETVKSVLTREQQSVLVLASDDPAKMVVALAANPAKLAELAEEQNFFKLAAKVAKLEGQMKMVKRRAPGIDAPERGSARMSPQTTDKKLKKLEEEAERTGDRTELIAYRKQLKAVH